MPCPRCRDYTGYSPSGFCVLSPGEHECPGCEGAGSIETMDDNDTMIVCDDCEGKGAIPCPHVCPDCNGTGGEGPDAPDDPGPFHCQTCNPRGK